MEQFGAVVGRAVEEKIRSTGLLAYTIFLAFACIIKPSRDCAHAHGESVLFYLYSYINEI